MELGDADEVVVAALEVVVVTVTPAHLPYKGWHPTRQCASVIPQYPYWEQQVLSGQLVFGPGPHCPLVDGGNALGGVPPLEPDKHWEIDIGTIPCDFTASTRPFPLLAVATV